MSFFGISVSENEDKGKEHEDKRSKHSEDEKNDDRDDYRLGAEHNKGSRVHARDKHGSRNHPRDERGSRDARSKRLRSTEEHDAKRKNYEKKPKLDSQRGKQHDVEDKRSKKERGYPRWSDLPKEAQNRYQGEYHYAKQCQLYSGKSDEFGHPYLVKANEPLKPEKTLPKKVRWRPRRSRKERNRQRAEEDKLSTEERGYPKWSDLPEETQKRYRSAYQYDKQCKLALQRSKPDETVNPPLDKSDETPKLDGWMGWCYD